MISTTDEALNTIGLTPYTNGKTVAYNDLRDVQTQYTYNGWGEVIRESSPDIGAVACERNALGSVTKKTDARGVVANYTYDAIDRLTAVNYPASSGENVTYTYDSTSGGNHGVGRMIGFSDPSGVTAISYNTRGLLASQSLTYASTTWTTTYNYDAAGNLFYMDYPSGRRVSYWRDSAGNIRSVAYRRSPTDPLIDIATDIEWLPFGNEARYMLFENGLNLWRTFDLNYRAEQLGLYNGSTALFDRFHGYQDNLNLTNIWDNVTPANSQSYWYSATNQLQNANGPWGADTFYQDGAQNQTWHIQNNGSTTTTDSLYYPGASNRLSGLTRNSASYRTFTYDAAGNIVTDVQGGVTTAFTYNNADRLASFTRAGTLRGTYLYNARGQLVHRIVTNSLLNGWTIYFYDQAGHPIAEYDKTSGALLREYVWLGDRPLSVIDPNGSGGDNVYYVHADHLNRPIALTNASKAVVANFIWQPLGGIFAYTGTVGLDLRFPGQMIQAESGLFYNWYRQYDPTIGRYTQPDPLGLVDGPSRYAYVGNDPVQRVDPEGLHIEALQEANQNFLTTDQSPEDRVCQNKDDCIDRCAMTLPTVDYGIAFQRCMLSCMSGGYSGFRKYDKIFREK